MPHEVSLITTIAAGLGLAFLMGLVVTRLGLPPLVGYLVAGIIIGPATPGFMLMMFGVGLHLSLQDLLAVRRIAFPGAVVQIVAATLMAAATAMWWGWSLGAALVLGLALSVASRAGWRPRHPTSEFDRKNRGALLDGSR